MQPVHLKRLSAASGGCNRIVILSENYGFKCIPERELFLQAGGRPQELQGFRQKNNSHAEKAKQEVTPSVFSQRKADGLILHMEFPVGGPAHHQDIDRHKNQQPKNLFFPVFRIFIHCCFPSLY